MALAAVHVADAPAGDDAIAKLQAALKPQLLAEIGWDPATQVLTFNSGHPVFGYTGCEVAGCNRPQQRNGLCESCERRLSSATGAGHADPEVVAEFKRVPRAPWRGEIPVCRVCCGDPHTRPAQAGSSLCRAHTLTARKRGLSDAGLAAQEEVVPLPTFGTCKRAQCGRLAAYGTGLCDRCYSAWRHRGKPDLVTFCAGPPQSERNQRPSVSFVGLPQRLTLELLYVGQRLAECRHSTAREMVEWLAGGCRRASAGSVTLVDALGHKDVERTLRFARRELDELYADPDAERRADVWNLRKLGLGSRIATLYFTGISQQWLREAAKQWTRQKLLSNTPDSVRRVLLGLNCLSESLRRRDDAGEAPLVLRRRDMLCFRERLYRLHEAGRLADTYYFDAAMCVRQFLRESVMFGLYESGGPLHGLSANFAVHDDDIPVKPRDEDDVGRALPQVVMDQLMSRESLALLPNGDMRALVRVEADIGRRPEEACALRALCLTTSESVNRATGEMESHWLLVHDMPKVGVVNHKLAIADATARVILEQQQRVKARYPGTPLKQLALFPRVGKNADGTVWIGSSTFSRVVRSWVAALPQLLGPGGVEFPRELVVPYAFRHSYAQRHADAGVALDVLAEMMGHSRLETTRGYYKVSKSRMREAVALATDMQLNHRGERVLTQLLDEDLDKYGVGQVAVPFGVCTEPSMVKSNGQSCPYKFKCFGCGRFRTGPPFLTELKMHLQRLLVDSERLNAATGGKLEEWARRDAMPPPEEVVAVRRLIRKSEELLGNLTEEERANVDELMAILRRARANIDTALPAHLGGRISQPQPAIYPGLSVIQAGR
jgi:integrase